MMDNIPAIVRILFIFVLILVTIKRKWMLGNAFLGGAMAMGILFPMAPMEIMHSAFLSLVHPKTLCLSTIVGLILILSHSLERSGQMTKLLNTFKGLIQNPRINLVIFPALIGLLPMPGGAIFSAPMVKNMGKDHRLSRVQLSYINYWYRHIWEYWWPLYPGILLTTALTGIDLWRLVLYTLPLTFVAFMVGYWPLRGCFFDMAIQPREEKIKKVSPFLYHLAPIAFVIFGGLGLGLLLSVWLPEGLNLVAKEMGLICALISAIFWVWHSNNIQWTQRWRIVGQPAMLKMIYMVSSILIFKTILEDSGAVKLLSQEMLQQNIPLMLVCIFLPFVVGGVSGISIAFVGATFPILISLIQALQQSHIMLPYIMLALASGFIGVLLSPLHMCLLLSNDYFKIGLMSMYKCMRFPLAVLLIASTAYFGILYYITDNL